MGQECENGQCVAMPNPDTCVAYGQACKDVGIPCCAGLTCGSGQGGSAVACWVRKTGRCDSTAECIFGTECVDGLCIAPVPPPPGPTCVAANCPGCGVSDQITPAAAETGCIGDACGCICKQAQEGIYLWTGDGCSAQDVRCPNTAYCYDMATNGPCVGNATFCCCRVDA